MNICQIDKNCIFEINKKSKRVSIFPCNPNSENFQNLKDKRLEIYLLEDDGNLMFIQKITNQRELVIHKLKSMPKV